MAWYKIDSWHLIERTWTDGRDWMVETLCGLIRTWDHTSLDQLPGGSETSCENCLIVMAGQLNPKPTKKPTKKKKG